MPVEPGSPQITPHEEEHPGSARDPEERTATAPHEAKEKAHDKTLADSFPTSDPPSTIPDPSAEARPQGTGTLLRDERFIGLPPGSWVAVSLYDRSVIGTGDTREIAERNARLGGHANFSLYQVPPDSDAPLQSEDAA
jgi:uncharacterized lipoprotein YbaY